MRLSRSTQSLLLGWMLGDVFKNLDCERILSIRVYAVDENRFEEAPCLCKFFGFHRPDKPGGDVDTRVPF